MGRPSYGRSISIRTATFFYITLAPKSTGSHEIIATGIALLIALKIVKTSSIMRCSIINKNMSSRKDAKTSSQCSEKKASPSVCLALPAGLLGLLVDAQIWRTYR